MPLSEFSPPCIDEPVLSQPHMSSLCQGLSCAELLLEIKTVFGRAAPRLAVIFQVSRETFTAWLNGETPAEQHRGRLHELASAARVFLAHDFKPTVTALDLTVARGKSFCTLITEGADGAEAAERLVKIIERSDRANARLDAILSDRPRQPLSPEDFGAEAFEETSG